MSEGLALLDELQMASFVARGFLRFDAVVPADINDQFMREAGRVTDPVPGQKVRNALGGLLAQSQIPEIRPGVPLDGAYPDESAIAHLLELPQVRGAIRSLVGETPIFDHHFLHVTFPPRYHEAGGGTNVSQHTHQDSTIDPRRSFDIQIMYYPHAVTREMGGTRFIPGTHLRKVSEVALGRYQNVRGQQHVVCEAGTMLFLHHGLWHGGGVNVSEETRAMFKIRIQPGGSQVRQFAAPPLDDRAPQRPIFFTKSVANTPTVASILMTPEPWFEHDTGRLEYLNRIKLWRYLSGDPAFDADYWLTRVENEAGAMA